MVAYTKIYLVGPMGVGKTTIGKGLATKLGYDFYDVDRVIEERAGADIAWIYDIEGAEGFRKREEKIIDEFTQLNRVVLATGGGAVLSPECRKYLSGRGFVVYLTAPVEKLHQRTEFDKKTTGITNWTERNGHAANPWKKHTFLWRFIWCCNQNRSNANQ